MRGQPGFFDADERMKRLSGLGDHLEAFSRAVYFEMLRPDLVAALAIPRRARAAASKDQSLGRRIGSGEA